jgi:hypothetical protein
VTGDDSDEDPENWERLRRKFAKEDADPNTEFIDDESPNYVPLPVAGDDTVTEIVPTPRAAESRQDRRTRQA